jgi:HAE1 family hydrophobic/amphiphilic exporter-1
VGAIRRHIRTMTRFALRYPYLIVVACLLTVVVGVTSLVRMPVDLFPRIDIPVVVVATFFSGMPPEQIENNITGRFERFFTLASGIDHIESRSLAGVSLIKIYFQPGQNADTAVSTIANLASANLRRLPPGTLPPVVLKFDASSLPVCLITLKGDNLSETQLRDTGQYAVRNQVAGVAGASVPQPFGGKYRQVMVYVDPLRLESHQLSVMDVVRSVNDSNLILPAGDVRIGPFTYNVYANSQLRDVEDVKRLPLKTVGRSSVLVGDVGEAKDAYQLQSNVVRVDGQRSVYLPVLKQGGDSNTIAVVRGVRERLASLVDVPKQLVANVVFDQSVLVRDSISNLLHEGALGLILTGLMIFLFLGSMRGTVAVFLSIPLSALAALLCLALGGSTVNSMVLGGLALAFSRLIDNSVVVLENIFRYIEMGESPEAAAEKGGTEMALPVLASTLTTVVVFFPVTLLYGVSRFLFSALALAVVFAMFASYAVALTVVPLFCAKFFKPQLPAHGDAAEHSGWFNARFNDLLTVYQKTLQISLGRPIATVAGISGFFLASLTLYPSLRVAYFPRTDPGQFVINMKAPSGTRVEITEKYTARVEEIIRSEVPAEDLDLIASNIGMQPDFSAIYTSNAGQHSATIQVSLRRKRQKDSFTYMDRVRKKLLSEIPEVKAYFQTGGLVDSVLNLGLPAPLDIQVTGSDLEGAHRLAAELAAKIRKVPGVSDVLVPQDIDYPALKLEVDRTRAAELGLTSKEVVQNVITSLTSGAMIAPSYFVDPKTGTDYLLTVQYPENYIESFDDLPGIPLRGTAQKQGTRLDAVSKISVAKAPTEVNHYQLRRIVDVFVAPEGEDLGGVFKEVRRILADTLVPAGMRVHVRGMVLGMEESFRSFGVGLLLSVVLVYLILVAQFQSFTAPLLILLAVPTGLAGVILTLQCTGTSLNVMSLMGVLMMVGIVLSNSILIVECIDRLRDEGHALRQAVALACSMRLRPILMTSLATLFGLLPMALKLGQGGEAYAPLATAILGGLSFSVLLTVFIVPAAYVWLFGKRGATDIPQIWPEEKLSE